MEIVEKLYEAVKAHSEMDDDQLVEAGEHGADAGWPGFIMTAECCEFYDANADAIYELAVDDAESMGCKNVPDMIRGFSRSDLLGSYDDYRNLMAWYALESVGRWVADKRTQ